MGRAGGHACGARVRACNAAGTRAGANAARRMGAAHPSARRNSPARSLVGLLGEGVGDHGDLPGLQSGRPRQLDGARRQGVVQLFAVDLARGKGPGHLRHVVGRQLPGPVGHLVWGCGWRGRQGLCARGAARGRSGRGGGPRGLRGACTAARAARSAAPRAPPHTSTAAASNSPRLSCRSCASAQQIIEMWLPLASGSFSAAAAAAAAHRSAS